MTRAAGSGILGWRARGEIVRLERSDDHALRQSDAGTTFIQRPVLVRQAQQLAEEAVEVTLESHAEQSSVSVRMRAKRSAKAEGPRVAPPWKGPWLIHFFQRHAEDDPNQSVPGRELLASCPANIEAKLVAIIKAVADAPPPMFSGGGKWEVMHDEMKGYYEARTDGKDREHFRLFCLLDRDGAQVGLGGPGIIIVTGARKPFRTTLSANDYAAVRALGSEFLKRKPRSVAT